MKHYPVIAELVDETSGKRFMPGDTFMPASEKQRKRLTDALCLGEDAVDPTDDLADLPLGELSREHLENIALSIARQQILDATDDHLRAGIASYRDRLAGSTATDGDVGAGHSEGEGNGQGQGGGAEPADDLDDTKVDDLKKLAADEEIDLHGKTLKADIVAAIREARAAKTAQA